MPTSHLNDVPEPDRERVYPYEIHEGDYVFDLPNDQWLTVDRLIKGRSRWWRLEQDEPGKWTFHHFSDTTITADQAGPGPGPLTGRVFRRKVAR
jgi:hypothetical protein